MKLIKIRDDGAVFIDDRPIGGGASGTKKLEDPTDLYALAQEIKALAYQLEEKRRACSKERQ